MKAVDAAARVGISLRQLDYWGRQGYLRVPADGSGYPRDLEPLEYEVLRLMKALLDVGFQVAPAARIARRYADAGAELRALRLSTQVTLTIERNS